MCSTVNVPGALSVTADGINNAGVIVGSYAAADSSWHGYIYANGQITTLTAPDSLWTYPLDHQRRRRRHRRLWARHTDLQLRRRHRSPRLPLRQRRLYHVRRRSESDMAAGDQQRGDDRRLLQRQGWRHRRPPSWFSPVRRWRAHPHRWTWRRSSQRGRHLCSRHQRRRSGGRILLRGCRREHPRAVQASRGAMA